MAELKFIVGSQGNLDYLVVAENDGIVLGVKLMFGAVSQNPAHGIMAGLRLRAARPALPGEVVTEDMGHGDYLFKHHNPFVEAFPEINFKKVSPTRASKEIGVAIPRTFFQVHQLQQELIEHDVAGALLGWVSHHVDENHFVAPYDKAVEWLNSQIEEQLDQAIKSVPTIQTPITSLEVGDMSDVAANVVAPNAAQTKAQAAGFALINGDGEGGQTEVPQIMAVPANEEDEEDDTPPAS